jgi:hypothetical protein
MFLFRDIPIGMVVIFLDLGSHLQKLVHSQQHLLGPCLQREFSFVTAEIKK